MKLTRWVSLWFQPWWRSLLPDIHNTNSESCRWQTLQREENKHVIFQCKLPFLLRPLKLNWLFGKQSYEIATVPDTSLITAALFGGFCQIPTWKWIPPICWFCLCINTKAPVSSVAVDQRDKRGPLGTLFMENKLLFAAELSHGTEKQCWCRAEACSGAVLYSCLVHVCLLQAWTRDFRCNTKILVDLRISVVYTTYQL